MRQGWLGLSLYVRLALTIAVGAAVGLLAAALLPDWLAWVALGALALLLPRRRDREHDYQI